jgi:type VII secretion protein EccE
VTTIVTEPANRVRAVARVGAAPATSTEPAQLRARRSPGQLGPIHILQIFVVEALVVGALALTGQGLIVAAGAGVVALLLTIATVARRHGRWWLDQWAMTRRFRSRAKAAPAGPDDQLADLWQLAPGLSVTEIGGTSTTTDSAATTALPSGGVTLDPPGGGGASIVAIARDDGGWYAVAEIPRGAAMADHPTGAVPLPMLVRTLAGTGQAGVVLQVVTQGVPAPAATVHPAAPAARSYQELTHAVGGATPPVERSCWVTVRLDAHLLADAGAGDEAEVRAPMVVAALLRRVVRTLHRVGLHARPLDRAGLLATLRTCCAIGEARQAPREAWRGWHGGQLSYLTYWVSEWPAPTSAPALLRALTSVPAAQTTLATMSAVPVGGPGADGLDAPLGDTEIRCLLRVGAPAETLDSLHETVNLAAREHGGQLHRLDGEHGPAIYATAPTGGGPW